MGRRGPAADDQGPDRAGAGRGRARQQHEDIVRAIERGDPDAAERAMREHIVYVQDLVSMVRRIEDDR
jgi:DNA-binding FadR family transcriptional regulator